MDGTKIFKSVYYMTILKESANVEIEISILGAFVALS